MELKGEGFFTVNTPGTKAVVGFAGGKPQQLGDLTLELLSPYASLFVTAAEPSATLVTAKSAVICAVARNCNSGFKYFAVDGRVLDNGKAPILLEPVKATLIFSSRPVVAVNVLDHSGKRTGKTFPRPQRFSVEQRLRDSFGVRSGQGTFEVLIRFNAEVSDYIREKKWHQSQQLRELNNGGVEVSFRLSSLEEVERWVLSWGGDAKVVKPRELAEAVKRAAKRILRS